MLKLTERDINKSGSTVKDNGFSALACGPVQYVVDKEGMKTLLFNQTTDNINIWVRTKKRFAPK